MACSSWPLCIPPVTVIVAYLLTPPSYPTELGKVPPSWSSVTREGWGDVEWPPVPNITDADRKSFDEAGYLVINGFFGRELVHKLLKEHVAWCGKHVPEQEGWHCRNEDVWLRTDTYRDFLYFGPIGKVAKQLLNVPGIRVAGDEISELRVGDTGSDYGFEGLHHGGIFGEFHQQTKGVQVFLFLTGVERNGTGGSLFLLPGGHRGRCVRAGTDPSWRDACRKSFYERARSFSLDGGDVIFVHPTMPIATQHPKHWAPPGLRVIKYAARLVESEAIFCGLDVANREGKRADCRHTLRRGEKAYSTCYTQIIPNYGPEMKDRLRMDWYTATCNVHRRWRYSLHKRLRLFLEDWRSESRMQPEGVGEERAECVYPPEPLQR